MPAAPPNLPDDKEALKAMVASLMRERDDLHIENLRLQVELDGYKKRYYGPRADRLQSADDLAQLLLSFGQELDRKPINPDDVPPHSEPGEELRKVKRRKGRRHLANFENLPVTTHVHELNAEQRSCPCCGVERKEIGEEESWQIEHIPGRFERIHHVRKKYACPACESNGDHPQMETATKPETAIEKGMAGPGLLAYIVTSKFAEYVPLYRLEDIFARQGFEISRATLSVWCGDVADLIEPLYQLMAERVRASHVVSTDDTIMPMLSTGKAANARMWVYVGDDDYPYNVFDFTLNRGRDGPKYFLQDYNQVLLADAYGGYNGVVAGNGIIRAGCWAHLRRKIIEAEKTAPEIARQGGSAGGGDRFVAGMLAACRGAAEAAGIDYPRLVYPYIEKQMSLAIPSPLSELCRLAEVSRAGFYRWKATPPPADPDMGLRDEVQRIALEFSYYGSRRITRELHERGWRVNRKKVQRLMREDNLVCLRKRRFVVTTDSNHDLPIYPNLARDMVLTGIDQLWVADLTYIRLETEFVYLAVILDAFSRKVIGWALDRTLEATLTIQALQMALRTRKSRPGLVHHSDRGVQYAAGDYTDLLKANGIQISMSRHGNPYDNAQCESFMKTLKYEEAYRSEYRDLTEARAQIGAFLEKVYNQKRLHSALGYVPLAKFEAQLAAKNMEAAAPQLVA